MIKICVLTLGCPKNIADSEYLISSLPKNKYIYTEIVEKANLLILNTCGFIASSIQESYEYIFALSELKRKNQKKKIIIFGCLVSRFGKNELSKKFPLVDDFFEVLSAGDLLKYLEITFNSVRSTLLTPTYYSYLKISDGCDRKCAFCTIPSIKGRYKYIPPDILLEEASSLANNRVKELILIAQETTNYLANSNNIYTNIYNSNLSTSNKCDFTSLLSQLSNINKLEWIRIMYAHPNSLNLNILNLMKERSNICKYIDIPLQHISDNILNRMNRGTSSIKIKQLIENIYNSVPNVAIRSTFIVGFPGETENDYQQLYNFLKEYKLARVGIFKYSQESGTTAADMPEQVSEETKEERFTELMLLLQKNSLEHNKNFINSKLKVLVESINKTTGEYLARTEYDAPEIDNGVIIKNNSNKKLKIGDFIEVTVSDAKEYDLVATV